ncbi:hypothetical protein ABT369_01205 [Dactylosporangium sp. NPDC000244]
MRATAVQDLGRAIAGHFARRGDDVLITGRDTAHAESTAASAA